MTFDEIRVCTPYARAIPLERVLVRIGAKRDRYDSSKWHVGDRTLSVTGMKFMDWTQGHGRGGAIDLVMHLEELDYKSAVEWLCQVFPETRQLPRTPPNQAKAHTWPARDDRKLARVRDYLTGERCLPILCVETLIASGQLYADVRANAVFLMHGEQKQVVGAELRGTTAKPWKGMARGSKKDAGYFSIEAHAAQAVSLCESAIDAISCHVLHPGHNCISTAGVRHNPKWLAPILQRNLQVYCGFDADSTGDAQAHAMLALHPSIQRIRPAKKD